jgi:hypothetical protein
MGGSFGFVKHLSERFRMSLRTRRMRGQPTAHWEHLALPQRACQTRRSTDGVRTECRPVRVTPPPCQARLCTDPSTQRSAGDGHRERRSARLPDQHRMYARDQRSGPHKACGCCRTVALVRSTVRSTVRNGERDRQRFDRTPSRRMLEEPTHRIRHSTHNDADRLLAVLPQHLSDTAPFSLTPGHRFANVKGQRWSATGLVRWQTWAHPDEVKARTGTSMLLNGNAAPVRNKQIDKL